MSNAKLKIASVVDDSVVDGPGYRYTIFTQGCAHNCIGCHNLKTHDYNAGSYINYEDISKDLKKFKYIKAVTFSGGEPLDQPEALAEFVKNLKNAGYHILIYTGYTYEQIQKNQKKFEAIKNADILIDGKFEITKKSLNLKYRGSNNQRIIDIQETIKNNELVLSNYN